MFVYNLTPEIRTLSSVPRVSGLERFHCISGSNNVNSLFLHFLVFQNLDGGGSSVSVYKGIVISKPTCFDTAFICERRVTTITCMQSL